MNDAVRPRASSRFDVLPDLLPETDATPLGTRTWADLFAPPQIGETDEVALAARLVSHLDGALTHPVGDDQQQPGETPGGGIVPSGFGIVPAARPQVEQQSITAGRSRVEAPAATSTPSRRPPARPKPHMSLDEYSRGRGEL